MTDDELLASWDDLCQRLIWRYGVAGAKARYEALADGEALDLKWWRRIGRHGREEDPPPCGC